MKRAWLLIAALGGLVLTLVQPAHAQSEYSLGKTIYKATGVILPDADGNWFNRDGGNEFVATVGASAVATAANVTTGQSTNTIPAIYNNGEFSVSSGSVFKASAIAGFRDTTGLVSYNGTVASGGQSVTGTENQVIAAGANLGVTGTLPGTNIVNPFKLAIKRTGGFSVGTDYLSTKNTDNPIRTGSNRYYAAKVFEVLAVISSGSDFNGPGNNDGKGTTVTQGMLLVAFEDSPNGAGDGSFPDGQKYLGTKGDFNDYVITIDAAPIPEPAFYQLAGLLAAGGVGMLRLRRKK